MVRTLLIAGLTAALTAGLVIGTASTAYAEPVCVCVTVYGPSINETSTGHQCQPTQYRTTHYSPSVGYPGVVQVKVDVFSPAAGTE